MNKPNINEYITVWGKPLAEDTPCGEDCFFSPEFEVIRAEVDKDTSLHAIGQTDWGIVSRLSSEFLNTHSKDIWVLAYAVYAEYHIKGIHVCPSAFSALTQILNMWWDALHPRADRIQRRLAPLSWLCARMEHSAKTTGFMEGSPHILQTLREEFLNLQNLLDVKAGDAAPSFVGIFSKIPDTDTTSPAEALIPAAPSQSSPNQAMAKPVTGIPVDRDARLPASLLPQLVRNVLDHTRQLAGHFFSLNMLDDRAYQLSRAALWGTLLQLPQVDASGITQLSSGVPADRIQAYTAAVEGKQYAEILPHLERSAGKAPFWFDGHVMVVRCLEGLGAIPAATHVRDSLASLLARFPELLTYKFKDSNPFASPRNMLWLEALCVPAVQEDNSPTIPHDITSIGGTNEELVILQEALACNTKDGFHAGLRRIGVIPLGKSRAAILHGLLQARYCVATGRKNAATRILSGLYIQMKEWDLLDWEPDLTARLLALLLSLQPKNKNEEMTRRLYLLNLEMALSIIPDN
ncbi:type VI secretion system protein TssA [Desulfosarcina sp. OttesenSCG-928-G10]|nr:type VI secretion system protein TssA [Desulfosarcina sp. OttesenSCG-928-G10]